MPLDDYALRSDSERQFLQDPRWSDDGSHTRTGEDGSSDGDATAERDLPTLRPLGHDDVWLSAPGEEEGNGPAQGSGSDMRSSPIALLDGSNGQASAPNGFQQPPGNTTTPQWSLDSFLLSRSSTMTLPDLRTELRVYLGQLKTELGQLIEDDYEEFISLGLGLRGEGERLVAVRDMLSGLDPNGGKRSSLKEEVHDVHSSLLLTQTSLRQLLDERSRLRAEKSTTMMLLHLHESLGRVEVLLGVVGVGLVNGMGSSEQAAGWEGVDEGEEDEFAFEEDAGSDEEDALDEIDDATNSSAKDPPSRPPIPSTNILTSSPLTSIPSITFPPSSVAAGSSTQLASSPSLLSSPSRAQPVLEVSALGRISSEFRQLVYLVHKADEVKHGDSVDAAGVTDGREDVGLRMQLIKSTLESQLSNLFAKQVETLFSHGATPLSGSSAIAVTAADGNGSIVAKAMSQMYEVLKVFDLIEGWRVAEAVFDRAVERELAKIIRIQALTVSPSPGVPETPYIKTPSANPFSPALAPSTPSGLTPSSSTSKNIFDFTLSKSGRSASSVKLLDEADRPLAGVYNRVLRFVERNCVPVMTVGERVRTRNSQQATSAASAAMTLDGASELEQAESSARALPALVPPLHGPKDGFEFLANVVWNQVGSQIIEELGSAVFAAGRVSSLHENFTLTHQFIDQLESLAPSRHAVDALRIHKVYEAFEKRWQLPVYFQLRWKEIVTDLDGSLSVRNAIGAEQGKDGYALPQTAATIRAIESCWSADVYIPELSYRFWRLSLQLLSRYRTWIERSVPALYEAPARRSFQQNGSSRPSAVTSRAPTPLPTAPPGPALPTGDPATDPASAVAEDNILRIATLIVTDLSLINASVTAFWERVIEMLLEPQIGTDGIPTVKDTLEQALLDVQGLSRSPANQIVQILTRKCTVNVKLIRSVASQLRATPASKMGAQQVQPSPFVSTILKPLRDYFAGIGSNLKGAVAKEWSRAVFVEVVANYETVLQAVRETEALLARHRKGKKTGFSLFGSAPSASTAGTDEEETRFRRQMLIDIQTLGTEATALGVELEGDRSVPGWRTLLETAERPTGET